MDERYLLDDFPAGLTFDTVKERLRLEDEDDIEIVRGLYEQALEIARPKAVYRVCYVDSIEGDEVIIGGVAFKSGIMAKNLKDIHRVFAYVVSCGTEIDEWSRGEEDYFLSLWLDMIKELILLDAVEQFNAHISEQYGLLDPAAMNPGSGDADVWPIAQQKALFRLIGGVEDDTGVWVTDSFLLVPVKSVSGILFPSDSGYVNCAYCRRADCPGRRADYISQAILNPV